MITEFHYLNIDNHVCDLLPFELDTKTDNAAVVVGNGNQFENISDKEKSGSKKEISIVEGDKEKSKPKFHKYLTKSQYEIRELYLDIIKDVIKKKSDQIQSSDDLRPIIENE